MGQLKNAAVVVVHEKPVPTVERFRADFARTGKFCVVLLVIRVCEIGFSLKLCSNHKIKHRYRHHRKLYVLVYMVYCKAGTRVVLFLTGPSPSLFVTRNTQSSLSLSPYRVHHRRVDPESQKLSPTKWNQTQSSFTRAVCILPTYPC